MNAHEVLSKLTGVRRCGNGWTARCPAHDDAHNSLSISEGESERVLIHCHAGCEYEAIRQALGIERQSRNLERLGCIVATYDYRDERGEMLFQSLRFDPKDFRQRRPDGAGWNYKLNGVRRVPYRLPELLAAASDESVFIVEGEKDASRLASLGFVATTNAGGAGKWRDEYSEYLRGRHVVIIPDNDEAGRKHAVRVAQSLRGLASSIRLLELPNLPPKGDVSDWLDVGGTAEELRALAERAPEHLFDEAQNSKGEALQIVRMADVEPETVRWLWYPYIAYGKLTFLEGDPGIGKSTVTCALASAVSCGRGLPNLPSFEPGNVLMLSAEDGLGDTLRPRLDAVGADVSRVFALAEPLTFDAGGLLRLQAAVIEHEPKLVIIDPLFAYTGGKVDIHRANECRAISTPLAAIAERSGCALIAVRHLGKARGGGHALNAGIGSIDFTAAARSVLLAGADPDEPNKKAIIQIKNNLAPHGEAIGYTLEDGQFYWTGASDLTAGRILAPASDEEERGTIAEATDFLRTALLDGPRDSKAIKDEAKQAGISEATLRRAKDRLKVRVRKVGMPGSHYQKWVWELPEAEGAQTYTEDAQTPGVEHLRTSATSKGDYDNNLTEGAQASELEHLRGRREQLRPTERVIDEIYIPPSTPNDVDSIAHQIAESSKRADGVMSSRKVGT